MNVSVNNRSVFLASSAGCPPFKGFSWCAGVSLSESLLSSQSISIDVFSRKNARRILRVVAKVLWCSLIIATLLRNLECYIILSRCRKSLNFPLTEGALRQNLICSSVRPLRGRVCVCCAYTIFYLHSRILQETAVYERAFFCTSQYVYYATKCQEKQYIRLIQRKIFLLFSLLVYRICYDSLMSRSRRSTLLSSLKVYLTSYTVGLFS